MNKKNLQIAIIGLVIIVVAVCFISLIYPAISHTSLFKDLSFNISKNSFLAAVVSPGQCPSGVSAYCGIDTFCCNSGSSCSFDSDQCIDNCPVNKVCGSSGNTCCDSNTHCINNTGIGTCGYSLNYSAGSDGYISSGSISQTVVYGRDGTAVTATGSIGYHFVNWSDSSTQNPRSDTNVKSDISVTANFVSNPTPTITFGTAPTPTYLGGNFTVSASTTNTDSSTLTYSYVSGPCAFVSGATFSSSGAGTCVVQADGAATTNFLAASQQQSVTISKATQSTLTVTGLPYSATYQQAGITAGYLGGSGGGTVTFDAGSSTACSVNSSTGAVTITASSGTCAITATKAADTNYNSATSASVSIAVGTAPQTITVNPAAPASATYNSTFPVSATASSGLTVTITTSGGCSISNGTVTMTSGTTSCTVSYNQSGDGSYAAATQIVNTTSAILANQSALTFIGQTVTSPATFSALSTTGGSSSGSVTYTVTTAGTVGCSINGTTLSYTSSGTCGVTATKASDSNYSSISSTQTFTVSATPTSTPAPTSTPVPVVSTGGSAGNGLLNLLSGSPTPVPTPMLAQCPNVVLPVVEPEISFLSQPIFSKTPIKITTVPTASPIRSGQSLASSILSGGVASENGEPVSGTFSFTNPSIKPPVGTYSGNITFTSSENTITISTVRVLVTVKPITASSAPLAKPTPIPIPSPTQLTAKCGYSAGPLTPDSLIDSFSALVSGGSGGYTVAWNNSQTGFTDVLVGPFQIGSANASFTATDSAGNNATGKCSQPVTCLSGQTLEESSNGVYLCAIPTEKPTLKCDVTHKPGTNQYTFVISFEGDDSPNIQNMTTTWTPADPDNWKTAPDYNLKPGVFPTLPGGGPVISDGHSVETSSGGLSQYLPSGKLQRSDPSRLILNLKNGETPTNVVVTADSGGASYEATCSPDIPTPSVATKPKLTHLCTVSSSTKGGAQWGTTGMGGSTNGWGVIMGGSNSSITVTVTNTTLTPVSWKCSSNGTTYSTTNNPNPGTLQFTQASGLAIGVYKCVATLDDGSTVICEPFHYYGSSFPKIVKPPLVRGRPIKPANPVSPIFK